MYRWDGKTKVIVSIHLVHRYQKHSHLIEIVCPVFRERFGMLKVFYDDMLILYIILISPPSRKHRPIRNFLIPI